MIQTSLAAWLKKPSALSGDQNSVVPGPGNQTPARNTTSHQPYSQPDPALRSNGEHHGHPDITKTQAHSGSQGLSRDSKSSLPPNVELAPITLELLPAFRRLNSLTFPIPYQDKFYNETVSDPVAASISLVALWHDTSQDGSFSPPSRPRVVASIRCRLLANSPSSPEKRPSKNDDGSSPSLYISTIATLSPFRNHGLAQALLQSVTRRAIDDYGVKTITAHVWEANTEGRQWYAKHGFKEVYFEENYYRRLKPSGAWVVERPITVTDILHKANKNHSTLPQ